jgi:hypothetical protein
MSTNYEVPHCATKRAVKPEKKRKINLAANCSALNA